MRALLTHTRRHGRAIVLLLLAATGFARTASADPPPVESDVVLAAKVSTAIAANPDLAGLNFTVDVVNRAAEIGGPVPDAAAIPRIEAAARSVPGVLSVRVTGWVIAPEDSLSAKVKRELSGVSPLPAKPAGPPLPTLNLVPRTQPAKDLPRSAPEPQPVTAQRMSATAGFLLAPIGPGGADRAYPTIPPTAVPTTPIGTLTSGSTAANIEAARTSNPRFARLTVELRGSTAIISGSARSGDAWDLAGLVRAIPGVERVVIGAAR